MTPRLNIKIAWLVISLLVFTPSRAQAQCESIFSLVSAEVLIETIMAAARGAVQAFIQNEITKYLFDKPLQAIMEGIDDLQLSFLNDLGDFGADFTRLFPDMTKQISVSRLDQTAKTAAFMAAENQILAQKILQIHERDARLAHKPEETATCVAASTTHGLPSKTATARAVTRALSHQSAKTSSLAKGTPAEDGPISDLNHKWDEHKKKYSEAGENQGDLPSTASGEWTDTDIQIASMVMNYTTIPPELIVKDEYEAATKAMARHLYEPVLPTPIPETTLASPTGLNGTVARRANQTRRQTAKDYFHGRIGDRTPDEVIQDQVQALRTAAGMSVADISDKPSKREALQTFAQARYMDPNFLIKIGADKPQMEEIVQKIILLDLLRTEYELTQFGAFMQAAELGMTLDLTTSANSNTGNEPVVVGP